MEDLYDGAIVDIHDPYLESDGPFQRDETMAEQDTAKVSSHKCAVLLYNLCEL